MKRGRKKKKKRNEPADKNTVCSDKSIQVCNFCSVFQTLLKSDFIDAVNTSEIHFPPKIFSKIQVRVICKCGLYTPVYSNTLPLKRGRYKKIYSSNGKRPESLDQLAGTPLHDMNMVGNHMFFYTYIWTEQMRIFVIIF